MARTLIAIAMMVILLGCVTGAFAQENCHDFRALNNQTYTDATSWVLVRGTTTGLLDQQPLSPDYVEYIPGNFAFPSAVAGRYWAFTQIWYFNDQNGNQIGTFTVTDYHSSFPIPTGKAGLAIYNGNGKITSGTGIFDGATGTLNESGPYLFWFEADGFHGKYNATYVAKICMK